MKRLNLKINPVRNPQFLNRVNPLGCLVIIVFGVMVAGGIVYALNLSSYQVPGNGGSKAISEYNTCKVIQNNNPKDIFVPTNTSAEWSSFLSVPPASININITDCDHAETLWNVNSTLNSAVIRDIAVDSTGVYVAGKFWDNGADRWFVEKRSLGDGSILWNTLPLGYEHMIANRIAVDDSGVYVGGSNVNGSGFVMKLSKDRVVVWDIGYQETKGIEALAIDNDYVYVGWSEISSTDLSYKWSLRKIAKNSGNLYWNNYSINPTDRDDYLRDIVALGGSDPSSYSIIVVGSSNIYTEDHGRPYNDPVWRIQKLLTNTNPGQPGGEPVSAWFNETINPSLWSLGDSALAVTLDNIGNLYVVGNESNVHLRTYKLNPSGDILWGGAPESALDISANDYFRDIAVDSTGIYIARDAADSHLVITKRNLNGAYIPLWEKDLGYTTTHSRIVAFGDGIYISNGSSKLEKRWPQ